MEQLGIFEIEEPDPKAGKKRPKERSARGPLRIFIAVGLSVLLGLFGAAFLILSSPPPPSVGERFQPTIFPISDAEKTAAAPQTTPETDPPEKISEIVPSLELSPAPAPPAPPLSPETETAKRDDVGIPPFDHTHLVRGSALKQASEAYRKDLSGHGSSFTLRLEVDCKTESVLQAFRKGDYSPAMFILPKKIEGKPCYAVMWGIYASKSEANNGYASLPPHFQNQKAGAVITQVKMYLE